MTEPVVANDAQVIGRLSALDRYLPVWILVAMAVGLLLGSSGHGDTSTHQMAPQ